VIFLKEEYSDITQSELHRNNTS